MRTSRGTASIVGRRTPQKKPVIIVKWTNMSYMKDRAIDTMNAYRSTILDDIYQSIRLVRQEEHYVSVDELTEALDEALGDEATIIAQNILKKHGV